MKKLLFLAGVIVLCASGAALAGEIVNSYPYVVTYAPVVYVPVQPVYAQPPVYYAPAPQPHYYYHGDKWCDGRYRGSDR